MSTPNPESPGTEPELASVDAGAFSQWLLKARDSLRGDAGTDVPCGDCVGCCVSAYHIPIRPTDSAALTCVAPEWLVSAAGQLLMTYRHDGTCPMLSENRCTIYQSRPQTCRDYDCRIFAAAGILPGGADKEVINTRVRAWRFSFPSAADQREHAAVRATADFIKDNRHSFPGARAPAAPTGIAVLAIKAYSVFLDPDIRLQDDASIAAAIIEASRAFDRP